MAINLLPWREAKCLRNFYQYWGGLLILSIFIVSGAFSLHCYLRKLGNDYKIDNQQLASQINSIQELRQLQKWTDDFQTLEQQIQLLKISQQDQQNFWKALAFLQTRLTEKMQLTQFSWTSQQLRLQGFTDHSELIGQLIQMMERSHLFAAVTLETVDTSDNNSLINFILNAHVL